VGPGVMSDVTLREHPPVAEDFRNSWRPCRNRWRKLIGIVGGCSRVSRTFGDRRGASKNVDWKSLPRWRFRARLMVRFAPMPDEEFLVIGDHQSCVRAMFNRNRWLKVSGIHSGP
jgi:hypothetical protein